MQINESEDSLSACNIGSRVISNSIIPLYQQSTNKGGLLAKEW